MNCTPSSSECVLRWFQLLPWVLSIPLPEGKGSDVNLASYLLVDAFENEYDVAIVVSNDSDLAEPIRLVKSRLSKRVVLLNPRKQTAMDLRGIADDYRQVRFGPLQASQFPDVLSDANGMIQVPDSWKRPAT